MLAIDHALASVPLGTQFFLLVGLQIPFWLACYTLVPAFVAKHLRQVYPAAAKNAEANSRSFIENLPNVKKEDVDQLDMVYWWAFMHFVMNVHHAVGALLGFASYFYASPTLFRLAVGTEMAEDIIHYCQLLVKVVRPPGPYPFSVFPMIAALPIVTHHALGLICGGGAFFHLADDSDVHFIVFGALGVLLPQLFSDLFKLTDQSKPSLATSLNLILNVFTAVFAFGLRVSYSRSLLAVESRLLYEAPTMAYAFIPPIVLITLTNILMTAVSAGCLLDAYKAATVEERVLITARAPSHVNLLTASPAVADKAAKLMMMRVAAKTAVWRARAHEAAATRKKAD